MHTTGLQKPVPKSWKNVTGANDGLVEQGGTIILHCFYCRAYMGPSIYLGEKPKEQSYTDKSVYCGQCRGDEFVEVASNLCQRCGLNENATYVNMQGCGSETPRILIVGEAPGKQEDVANMPFVGPAGGLLRDMLSDANIPEEWVRFTNVVRCCPHDDNSIRTPTQDEMLACRHYIEREICEYQPELVIAVGATAALSLIGKKTITKLRGGLYPLEILHLGEKPYAGTFQVLPIIHPAAVLRGNEKYRDLIFQDLVYARRIIQGEAKQEITFQDLDTVAKVEGYVDRLIRAYDNQEFDFISVDLESSSEGPRGGLDIFHPTFRILCVTICRGLADKKIPFDQLDTGFIPYKHKHSPFVGDLLVYKRINAALTRLFSHVPLAGQNFQFDHTSFIASTNIKIPDGSVRHDTMLAAWVLSNDTEPHDLDYLATKYTDYVHPKERMRAEQEKLKKGQDPFEDVPYNVFQEYACGDVVTVAHLVPVQLEMLREIGLDESIFGEKWFSPHKLIWVFHYLSMQSHDPAVEMRKNGVFIDQPLLAEVEKREESQLNEYFQWFVDHGYEKALKDQYDYKLVLGGWQSMNLLFHGVMGLPYQVEHYKEVGESNWLAKRGFAKVQGSTDQETIKLHIEYLQRCKRNDSNNVEYYDQTIEALKVLLDYRVLNKHFTSYVKPLYDFIGEDGCAHSNFGIRTTGTSRWTAYDPTVQTVPFMSQVKRVYRSRFEDGVIVAGDYSQMELREAARISGDSTMLGIFKSGMDIHRATAARILGKSLEEVTAHERRKAKTTNFGILYGATPFTISAQSGISLEEAEEFVDRWLKTFSKIRDYMKFCESYVKEHGCIYTSLGARRLLPDVYHANENIRKHAIRQAMNTPIQGQSSDWATFALQGIYRGIKERGLHSKLWAFIHDSIEADVPVFELFDYTQLQHDEMTTNLVQRFPMLTVPLKVDFEIGLNWGEMVDLELLSDRRLIITAHIDDEDKPESTTWIEQIMEVVRKSGATKEKLLDEGAVSYLLKFPELTSDRMPVYTTPGFQF